MIPNQKMEVPSLMGRHLAVGPANGGQAPDFDALADSFGSLLEKNGGVNKIGDGRGLASLDEQHSSLLKQIANSKRADVSLNRMNGAEKPTADTKDMMRSEEFIDMESYFLALKRSLSEIDEAGRLSEPRVLSGDEEGILTSIETQIGEQSVIDAAEVELRGAAEMLILAASSNSSEVGSASNPQVNTATVNSTEIADLVIDGQSITADGKTLGTPNFRADALQTQSDLAAQANANSAFRNAVSGDDAGQGLLLDGEQIQNSGAANAATILGSMSRSKSVGSSNSAPQRDATSTSSGNGKATSLIETREPVGVNNAKDQIDLTSLNARNEQGDYTESVAVAEEGRGAPRVSTDNTSVSAWQQTANKMNANSVSSDGDAGAPAIAQTSANVTMTANIRSWSVDRPVGDQVLDGVKPEILAMQRANLSPVQMQAANPFLNKSVISLQLHPVGLGRLQALMQNENNSLKVELVVESKKTLDLLNADIDSLKASMRALGVTDENITVTMARNNNNNGAASDENSDFNLNDQRFDQSENYHDGTRNGNDGFHERQESAISNLDQPAEIRVRTHDGVHRITI